MKRVLKFVSFCSFILLQGLCVASDYDQDNPPEDTRTLEELEQCPCVQEYVFQKYGEDLTAPATQQKKKKKKKKKTKGRRQQNSTSSYDSSFDNEGGDDYAQNRELSSRQSSRGRSNNRDRNGTATQGGNRQQQQGNSARQRNRGRNRDNGDNSNSSSQQTRGRKDNSNSWMDETAWMNQKNPHASINLMARNSATSFEDGSSKNGVEVLKDLEIKARSLEKQKYRISEKESIRFRQELEKYRQALA